VKCRFRIRGKKDVSGMVCLRRRIVGVGVALRVCKPMYGANDCVSTRKYVSRLQISIRRVYDLPLSIRLKFIAAIAPMSAKTILRPTELPENSFARLDLSTSRR
jgi:hypothetical protein